MLIGSRSVILGDKTYNVNLTDCDGEYEVSVIYVENLFCFKTLFEKRFENVLSARIAFRDLVLDEDSVFQKVVDSHTE